MGAATIGRVVGERRREAGFTQGELADRIGTTQAAISKIETGRTMPTLALLERVAVATGRPIVVTLGSLAPSPSRRELRERVRRVLGDYEFDPWERDPSPAEVESLLVDGLTRERFSRVDDLYVDRLRQATAPLLPEGGIEFRSALGGAGGGGPGGAADPPSRRRRGSRSGRRARSARVRARRCPSHRRGRSGRRTRPGCSRSRARRRSWGS